MRIQATLVLGCCWISACTPVTPQPQLGPGSHPPTNPNPPFVQPPPPDTAPPPPSEPPTATDKVRIACNAYTTAETAEKIGFYFTGWVNGGSLQGSSGVLGVSEDQCRDYSYFGPDCSSYGNVCQDMCQTCDAAVIDLVYNGESSVFDRISPVLRTACPAYTESEIGRKILSYDTQAVGGVSQSGAIALSEGECRDYSYFGARCSSYGNVCQDMCQTCDAAVIDLVYNGNAGAFARITATLRTACAAYTESEIGRKILSYDTQAAGGVGQSGAIGASEGECRDYSYFGPRCTSYGNVCQDMCETCDSAVIDLVYNGDASVFDRLTPALHTACAAYTESEIARKILSYDTQGDIGVSQSAAIAVSENECRDYSYFGPRCTSYGSVCQDMCQTCDAAAINLVYGN